MPHLAAKSMPLLDFERGKNTINSGNASFFVKNFVGLVLYVCRFWAWVTGNHFVSMLIL